MTAAFNLSQLANNLNTSGQLDATDGLSGAVPIANGGTGQTSAANAINALLPSQTGNSGKFLTTNGSAASWALAAAEYQVATATTTTDRSLVGDSGWVDHLSVTFTTTQQCTVMCFANFAHAREDGPVQVGARFTIDGTTSTEDIQAFKQGFSNSYAFGAHSSTGFLINVSAGSHTVVLQCRNFSSGSTGILNYWDNPGPSTAIGDRIYVLYK